MVFSESLALLTSSESEETVAKDEKLFRKDSDNVIETAEIYRRNRDEYRTYFYLNALFIIVSGHLWQFEYRLMSVSHGTGRRSCGHLVPPQRLCLHSRSGAQRLVGHRLPFQHHRN